MPQTRFSEGNLIVLYANFKADDKKTDGIPEYLNERLKTFTNVYGRILKSKPDRLKTEILLVSSDATLGNEIKQLLCNSNYIDVSKITIVSDKSTLADALEFVLKSIKERANPPTVYVIASHWYREIYDAIETKFNGYQTHFEGALDHRPLEEIVKEKQRETPKKGIEFYKDKAKNKALDLLLNHIFPDKKES
ncbi:MAG: hypothetical protein WCE96_03830 [Nitrososphaeraceae archaeon]